MKLSKILSVAALSSLVALGASAEEYQGVLQFQSTASRAEVRAQAVETARGPDLYADGTSAGVSQVVASNLDRSSVRAEAVATAGGPDLYAEGASSGVAPVLSSTLDRATVRAEARSFARRFNLASM